jgi:hypothetical protein
VAEIGWPLVVKPIATHVVERSLAERVAGDAARRFGLAGLPQLAAAWRIVNPYSVVLCLEYRHEHWRQRFFAKLARNPLTCKERLGELLKVEFDILRKLHPLSEQTASTGTVEALALYLDIPSLVTIEARGPTLRKAYAHHARLWSAPGDRSELLRLSERCGSWLAGFHDQTAQGPGSLAAADQEA